MILRSKKLLTPALLAAFFCPAGAWAANWVTTPPNPTGMTAMFDADSAYQQGGLIYVITCGDRACIAAPPGDLFGPQPARIDCAAKTVSYYDSGKWSPPAHQAKDAASMNDDEYQPDTDAAMTITAICAQKDSWPKR